jgi:SAM-dependent methyltransferase
MKKYFEYAWDDQVKTDLEHFYNQESITQHNAEIQKKKTEVKLFRIQKMIDLHADDTVLDIGCSRGLLLARIASSVREGVGLDISQSIIEENAKSSSSSNIRFQSYDGIHVPYTNEFSVVFMIDVLEHAFYPNDLLPTVVNSMKPGGKLVIEVPFSGWLSELMTKKYHQGHLRYYDPNYLKAYLEARGLSVEDIRVYNSMPFAHVFLKNAFAWAVSNGFVNAFPPRFYPYFGSILAVATKKETMRQDSATSI